MCEMHALGNHVTVYVYDRDQPAVNIPDGVVVNRFCPRWRSTRYALLPLWFHRQVRHDRPDVVLSLLTYSNVVALLTWMLFRHKSLPLVISEHNTPSLQWSHARTRDRITFWLARRLYRRATGVLAVSHPVAGDLVSTLHVSAERLFIVQNPIIPNSPSPRSASDFVMPKRLHLAFVGRLVDQKRPSLFLEVLRTLAQRNIHVRATIIGDGPLRTDTETKARDTGLDVFFAGWREPWWEAASELDCIVVTASFEGLGNVLIEAAAVQIPCVACSRALGVADAILPGVTGELTMTDHPDDYADAVLRAWSRRTSNDRLDGWLDHFSSERSTIRLLTALRIASRQTHA